MPASTRLGTTLARTLTRKAFATTAHQAIAFDAVARLSMPAAEAWERLFLRHGALFALGAAAPDAEFRDFRNHVVFPRDGYWGGAIAKAQSWYLNLTAALERGEWQNAAYCAGVLSHYVIDALHPLHTAQSEADNDIAFALDHAVWRTYGDLAAPARAAPRSERPVLPSSRDFLAVALGAAAAAANANYEKLLAQFDLSRAVVDSSAAFDATGRKVMAGVIGSMTALLAAILDRAIEDAKVKPVDLSLTRHSLHAAFGWPLTAVSNGVRARDARRLIAVMHDELMATGHVTSLPDEVRAKRDLYAKEVTANRAKRDVDNVFPFEPRRAAVKNADKAATRAATGPAVDAGDDDRLGELIPIGRARMKMEPPRPAPPRVEAEPPRRRADVTRQLEQDARNEASATLDVVAKPAATSNVASHAAAAVGHAAAASLLAPSGLSVPSFRDRRSPVRAAEAAGGAEDARAAQPATRSAPDLLVSGVSALDAEWLAAVGYTTPAMVAAADPEKLCADLLAHDATEDGRRLLQQGEAPDVAHVRALVAAVQAVQAA